MGVFEVEQSSFDDLSSFNHHLANDGRENINSDLYIVAGLSQFSQQEFFEILTQRGYTIEDFGAIQKISRTYTTSGDAPDDTIIEEEEAEEEDNGSERVAEFYLYYDEESGVTLFYTDQRKTKEIKYTVAKLLDGERGLHYLYIGPGLFRDIRREIIRNEEIAEITKFVADRLEGSDYPCRIQDILADLRAEGIVTNLAKSGCDACGHKSGRELADRLRSEGYTVHGYAGVAAESHPEDPLISVQNFVWSPWEISDVIDRVVDSAENHGFRSNVRVEKAGILKC